MLLLDIDETSSIPKYIQIIEQIRHKIETNCLKAGDRLPSTRKFAEKFGMHRTTVAMAYQELWALGYIELNPGTCPIVRERVRIAAANDLAVKGLIDWGQAASTNSNEMWDIYINRHGSLVHTHGKDVIDIGSMDMDRRLFPVERFRACFNQAVKNHGAHLLDYGSPQGLPELRDYLASRMQNHGISVSEDEVMITNGVQQSMDLVLRLLAAPGKKVAIESPSYKEIIPLLRYYGFKVVEIPMRADGMDLDILEDSLSKEQIALIYTMPNFQNPTGISTSHAHRERLLAIAEKYRVPVMEDGFEEEMKYFGKVVLPIKSMDRNKLVIYCGTFSKVLFPGVRIGWIAADRECIDRLAAIRKYSELSSGMVMQAAAYQFCQQGSYDRHVGKMHRAFRKRMDTAISELHMHISPDWAEWSEPNGGYLIWLKLKAVYDVDWNNLFAENGVYVVLGDQFFYTRPDDTYIRLSISALNEEEIREGIIRLAKALRSVYENNESI